MREDKDRLLDILEGERDRAEDRYERESEEWREERESMLAAMPSTFPPGSQETIQEVAHGREQAEVERDMAERMARQNDSVIPSSLVAGVRVDDPPTAKNGEPCDCETPGDWHRVAGDFQQAMFRAQRERDALKEPVGKALYILQTYANADDALAAAKPILSNALADAAILCAARSSEAVPAHSEEEELAEVVGTAVAEWIRARARAALADGVTVVQARERSSDE